MLKLATLKETFFRTKFFILITCPMGSATAYWPYLFNKRKFGLCFEKLTPNQIFLHFLQQQIFHTLI